MNVYETTRLNLEKARMKPRITTPHLTFCDCCLGIFNNYELNGGLCEGCLCPI